jgi:hypothetical protein
MNLQGCQFDALKIFIRSNPYKERIMFHDFLKKVRSIPAEMGGANILFVEDVAYQKVAIEEMERADAACCPEEDGLVLTNP